MIELTSRQKKFLKGKAHHLTAAYQMGKEGMSSAFITGLLQALAANELVKVQIPGSDEGNRGETAELLAQRCDAAIVQLMGRKVTLYKPNPDKPVIDLTQI